MSRTSFQAVMLAAVGQNAIQYVNKATTALVLYFGATAAINGELTVGELSRLQHDHEPSDSADPALSPVLAGFPAGADLGRSDRGHPQFTAREPLLRKGASAAGERCDRCAQCGYSATIPAEPRS